MNQFKGTPGPWYRESNTRAIGPIIHDDDDQCFSMIDHVAFVEFQADKTIEKANAQLIASAPELLEALECAKQHLRFAVEVISAPHHADLIDSLVAQTNQVLLHVECALIRATGE